MRRIDLDTVTEGQQLPPDAFVKKSRIAVEIGARPEIGHCHRVLGQLSASSEHAAAARRIFDELGMAFWNARV